MNEESLYVDATAIEWRGTPYVGGDWEKLLYEVRDSHWMMVYGDHLKEVGYAARKIGVDWVSISDAQVSQS